MEQSELDLSDKQIYLYSFHVFNFRPFAKETDKLLKPLRSLSSWPPSFYKKKQEVAY